MASNIVFFFLLLFFCHVFSFNVRFFFNRPSEVNKFSFVWGRVRECIRSTGWRSWHVGGALNKYINIYYTLFLFINVEWFLSHLFKLISGNGKISLREACWCVCGGLQPSPSILHPIKWTGYHSCLVLVRNKNIVTFDYFVFLLIGTTWYTPHHEQI